MNKMKKFGLWIGATMMAMPMSVSAFESSLSGSGIDSWEKLVGQAEKLIGYFIAVVAIVATVMIILGGLQYVIQGKPDEGKNKVTYGIIGLVIALLAYSIVKIVVKMF